MRKTLFKKTGGIIFFIGIIIYLVSILHSYPIELTSVDKETFSQFYPGLWPAIIFLSLGIFIIGYYSEKKIAKGLCCSIIPLIFYSYVYFFTYVPSSDCGNVRSMFLVFNEVGINIDYVSYFQYPSYFLINDLTTELIELNVNQISFIYFTVYGALLGLFLYLLYTRIDNKDYSFIFVVLYFIGIYSFLNYQWVPQTLALVYLFILFYMTLLCSRIKQRNFKYLIIISYIPFIFSHAFLPAIFNIFLGLVLIKNKSLKILFTAFVSAYAIVMIYYTTSYLPIFIESLINSLSGFSGEYTSRVAQSFRPPEELISELISTINRFRVPLTWLLVSIGSFIMFIKKKMHSLIIILGIAGTIYLIAGSVLSVLGLRSIQVILIANVVGITFFIKRFKKPTMIFIIILLLLSVFGPMREAYNTTLFHTDEEAQTCTFLASTVNEEVVIDVATNQVNFGFFKNIHRFHSDKNSNIYRSGTQYFYEIFNQSMKEHDYVIYSPNLGKEMIRNGIPKEKLHSLQNNVNLNNKIFSAKWTYILKGIN